MIIRNLLTTDDNNSINNSATIDDFINFSNTLQNDNDSLPWIYELEQEDANWIMTSSFMIFSMQTGFGLLESGAVSIKNEVNIMMKNVADIVLGGLTYWMFGYGFSFGRSSWSNPFICFGDFFIDPVVDDQLMGNIFAAFLFQLSFATTATTIVSGAMAERCNFKAYCLFSLLNTVVYCVPARWVWGEGGFLRDLGAVDIAGSGPVHLVGGSSAVASAWMLGPRLGRYMNGIDPLPLGSPVNAVMGLFVLWWGWLAFNSGSTYGVSGKKWHYAAGAAVMTMLSSFGGGCFGLFYSLLISRGETVDLMIIINAILGALVSITAGCFLYNAWESILIGVIGAALACLTMPLIDKIGIDDPVGATSVHGICGMWGVLAVGLFAGNPTPLDTTNGREGVFRGGGFYLLGIQALTIVCLASWSVGVSILLLWFVNKIIPIRMNPYEELVGADLSEHKIRHGQVGVSRALSTLGPVFENNDLKNITQIGYNPGHDSYLKDLRFVNPAKFDPKKKLNKNQKPGLQIFHTHDGQVINKPPCNKTNFDQGTGHVNMQRQQLPQVHQQNGANKSPKFAWLD